MTDPSFQASPEKIRHAGNLTPGKIDLFKKTENPNAALNCAFSEGLKKRHATFTRIILVYAVLFCTVNSNVLQNNFSSFTTLLDS